MSGTPAFRPSRRIVFQGLGALGVAAALAGCGGGSDEGGGGGGAAPEAGAVLATTAEVPVGGGIVLADQNLVLTQPTEGEFKAFIATCTHTGTQVNEVTDAGEIVCPNHGSKFAIADGAVLNPPASSPLEAYAVTVDGDNVVAA